MVPSSGGWSLSRGLTWTPTSSYFWSFTSTLESIRLTTLPSQNCACTGDDSGSQCILLMIQAGLLWLSLGHAVWSKCRIRQSDNQISCSDQIVIPQHWALLKWVSTGLIVSHIIAKAGGRHCAWISYACHVKISLQHILSASCPADIHGPTLEIMIISTCTLKHVIYSVIMYNKYNIFFYSCI